MSNWLYLMEAIPGIINDPWHATTVSIGGYLNPEVGGAVGGIVGDACKTIGYTIWRRKYTPCGILHHVEMIKNDRTSHGRWRCFLNMIQSIYDDKKKGQMVATWLETYRGQVTREDGDKKENLESKKEKSDPTNNFDGDTHAQSTSSNSDASEGEKAPSTSSGPDASEGEKVPSTSSGPGVPGCEMKGPSHPEFMPQKSRKRPFSDQDLEFQAIKRIKPSTATLY